MLAKAHITPHSTLTANPLRGLVPFALRAPAAGERKRYVSA